MSKLSLVIPMVIPIFTLCLGLLILEPTNQQISAATPPIPRSTTMVSNNPLQATEGDFAIANYEFANGQKLAHLNIHYATLGTPQRNAKGEIVNAALLLHWSGGSGAKLLTDSFKEALYDPGKPLDASKYFLIIPDSLGHGLSSKPSDGLRMQFPSYTYYDMVALQHKLLTDKLGITHLKMVIGTSMGGMHTWLWSELYPDFMDGVMPIVSLPTSITGRNLLWRKLVVSNIKNDPSWNEGNYTTAPRGLIDSWPFVKILLDGVPHLHAEITGHAEASSFLKDAQADAAKIDANDILYSLEASRDYNPEPLLGSIKTKVFALDFTDDQLDPIEDHTLEKLIVKVKNGRVSIQEGTSASYGHLTMMHPALWAEQVRHFIEFVDSPNKI